MRAVFTRAQLLPALQQAAKLASGTSPMPILSHVLLRPTGQLEVTATDIETQIIARADVSVEGDPVTLPARTLLDIVRLLPDATEVRLVIDGGRAEIRCGKSRYRLNTLPAEQYPAFDAPANAQRVAIDAGLLRRALRQTAFAMAVQDVRYYLNGLHLEISADAMTSIGSDGHRLAMYQTAIESTGSSSSVILPRRAVAELLRLLPDDGQVSMAVGYKSVEVDIPSGLVLSTKLIEGNFPDWRRVVPTDAALVHRFQCPTALLRAAVSGVILLAPDSVPIIRLTFAGSDVTVESANESGEQAEQTVELLSGGAEISVAFNGKYLIDALAGIEGDTCWLGLNEAGSSALVWGDDPAYRCVVMPIRT